MSSTEGKTTIKVEERPAPHERSSVVSGNGSAASASGGISNTVNEPLLESTHVSDSTSSPKRKSTVGHGRPGAKRQHTSTCCEEYRQLLNGMIQDVSDPKDPYTEETRLHTSQIGASYWTSEEKNAFFKALDVLGKDNVAGIASRIKTKSAPEVTFYMQLLQQKLVERHLEERDHKLLGVIDMPAAVEVSEKCCSMLDQEAALLELEQMDSESCWEKCKWDDLWLLTADTAQWAEQRLGEGTEGAKEVERKLPAAGLLKLHTWLELSERVFMNPGSPREDDNWHTISNDGELPSIRATAFEDMASLAVSITERLVQATLFQAMSRCRAIDSKSLTRGFSVKAEDVRSACEVLGMEHNSHRFWSQAARRCGLHVYQRISDAESKSTNVQPMSYEEVEDMLSGETSQSALPSRRDGEDLIEVERHVTSENDDHITHLRRSRSTSVESPAEANGTDERSFTDPDTTSSTDDDVGGSSDTLESDLDHPFSREARLLARKRYRRELQLAEDRYLEAIDMQASSIEEARLWEMRCAHEPTTTSAIKQEEEKEERAAEIPQPPPKPKRMRKTWRELIDWRQRVEYWAEWETTQIPSDEE